MENLPITRDKAIEYLLSLGNTTTEMNHYLETEIIMRNLAKHFNENQNYWAMLGLLHDIDWAITKNNVKEHTIKAKELLEELGFDEIFISLVQSHTYSNEQIPEFSNKKRKEKVEYCLAASETITGLIYAYALMRDKTISDMTVKGLKKKFKDKAFAQNCNREIIKEIENTGLDLSSFFDLSINSMKEIKQVIGLN